MESPSKIDLHDVSWWMSIKYAYKPGLPVTTRLSKEGCISLVARRRSSRITCKHNLNKCGVTTLKFGVHDQGKGMERCGLEVQPRSHICILESVKE
jgi:hypothetical protein